MNSWTFDESAKMLQDYADGLPEVVRGSLANARPPIEGDTPHLEPSLISQAEIEMRGIKSSIDHLILFYNRVYESLNLDKPYPTPKELEAHGIEKSIAHLTQLLAVSQKQV